jgi:hypothetical protein
MGPEASKQFQATRTELPADHRGTLNKGDAERLIEVERDTTQTPTSKSSKKK